MPHISVFLLQQRSIKTQSDLCTTNSTILMIFHKKKKKKNMKMRSSIFNQSTLLIPSFQGGDVLLYIASPSDQVFKWVSSCGNIASGTISVNQQRKGKPRVTLYWTKPLSSWLSHSLLSSRLPCIQNLLSTIIITSRNNVWGKKRRLTCLLYNWCSHESTALTRQVSSTEAQHPANPHTFHNNGVITLERRTEEDD